MMGRLNRDASDTLCLLDDNGGHSSHTEPRAIGVNDRPLTFLRVWKYR